MRAERSKHKGGKEEYKGADGGVKDGWMIGRKKKKGGRID